jgi:hypothetical protein
MRLPGEEKRRYNIPNMTATVAISLLGLDQIAKFEDQKITLVTFFLSRRPLAMHSRSPLWLYPLCLTRFETLSLQNYEEKMKIPIEIQIFLFPSSYASLALRQDCVADARIGNFPNKQVVHFSPFLQKKKNCL